MSEFFYIDDDVLKVADDLSGLGVGVHPVAIRSTDANGHPGVDEVSVYVLAVGAPALTAPSLKWSGSTTANLAVHTTGDDGDLYWVVTQSPVKPTREKIMAGEDHAGNPADASGSEEVVADGEQTAGATGLDDANQYWAHFVHEDGDERLSNVVSSPAMMFDPHFANVAILCGFDGADGATTAVDESSYGHTLNFHGNAQIDDAKSLLGGAALLLDGAGDWVQSADHAAFTLGSGDFTIEAPVAYSAVTNDEAGDAICAHYNATGNQRGFYFKRHQTVSDASRLRFAWSPNGSGSEQILDALWTPSTDTFYWVAVERHGNTWRLYIDGAMVAKQTNANNIFNSSDPLMIGRINSVGGFNAYHNGWIDELRITPGVARYASDGGYTPPTAPFPRFGPSP